MISHTHKFIIITPAKTGSVSVTSSLLKYANYVKIVPDDRVKDCFDIHDEFGQKTKHASIKKIYRLWNQDKYGQLNDYYKIGTVRNPWERLISFYQWQDEPWRKKIGGFSSFIKKSKRPLLGPCCGSFSFNGEIVINDYIRFENLQKDFNIVCDKIGIARQELPHKNKTNHKHYSEYYNDETREIVAKRFKKDIDYFGYEFGE